MAFSDAGLLGGVIALALAITNVLKIAVEKLLLKNVRSLSRDDIQERLDDMDLVIRIIVKQQVHLETLLNRLEGKLPNRPRPGEV